jgi:hypothetical protein
MKFLKLLVILYGFSPFASGLVADRRSAVELAAVREPHPAIHGTLQKKTECTVPPGSARQSVSVTKRELTFTTNQGKLLYLGIPDFSATTGAVYLSKQTCSYIAKVIANGLPGDAGGSTVSIGGVGFVTWTIDAFGDARPVADALSALVVDSIVYDYLYAVYTSGSPVSTAQVSLGLGAIAEKAKSGYEFIITLNNS